VAADPLRTVTRSVETSASVAAVLAVLADPTRLPLWAPAFADRIDGDAGSGWKAIKNGRESNIRVAVEQAAGTVDSSVNSRPVERAAPTSVRFPAPTGVR